ncbi:MAG: SDR family oxidoreductase [Mesorhizobium sp.]|nr:MAG: SDR family oxidoreductase [Mesorhizobium sp.]
MARSARRPKVVEPERGVLAEGAVAVGQMISRNPVMVGGSTAFLVTLFYVSANALWYQPFPHTGAFFATRSIENFPHAVSNEPETTINIVRQAPAQPAPRPDPVVQQVQGILKDLNFYDGTVDGLTGPATRRAIQAYQVKVGLPSSGEIDDALLRRSFELNFFAHQSAAQNAVRIMLEQGTGGVLLFNTSKQAINPGPKFGAYGIPKAATLFLSRQYALDYGAHGIRSNAVNADRIRSGLLTDAMIASRSGARGVSEKEYMSGNLLGQEVTADDVAQAFLHQALAERTTADVTTVDGGNIAAALR